MLNVALSSSEVEGQDTSDIVISCGPLKLREGTSVMD